MIVLDTTVLVYAVGTEHPLREACRTIVAAAAGGLRATTTAEVVQEFAHIRSRRRGRADATELARRYASLLSPLIPVDSAMLEHGLALFERHPSLGCFDAVLAAASLASGATALVSADRAFAEVERLRHVDPLAPDLETLLDLGSAQA